MAKKKKLEKATSERGLCPLKSVCRFQIQGNKNYKLIKIGVQCQNKELCDVNIFLVK